VEIQVGRQRRTATARVIPATDPNYPRLCKLVNDRNHGRYKRYQTQTKRAIPLVAATPAP
jgi:F420H(2)-dependent quinone reductase